MNEHWIDRLSDYLDGDLPPAEVGALERHVLECGTCADALGELRQVTAQARTLPELAPDRDLWPGIEARIVETPRREARPSDWGFGWIGKRLSFTIPQIAAAAAALVLVSSGAMWLTFGRTSGSRPGAVVPSTTSRASMANFDETRYGQAIAELEDALRQHRAELDSSTVRVLEENLALIDQATMQARRALVADPGNPYLNGHLAEQLKRKIWLLQRATAVVAAQS